MNMLDNRLKELKTEMCNKSTYDDNLVDVLKVTNAYLRDIRDILSSLIAIMLATSIVFVVTVLAASLLLARLI